MKIAIIIDLFKTYTHYISKTYPNERFAFTIDKPSANAIFFRTKFFGDWKDNIQVSIRGGEDFFWIYQGDTIRKTKDFNELENLLKDLYTTKKEKFGTYLSNEYSDNLSIHNSLV
jgi:hypothetical protein